MIRVKTLQQYIVTYEIPEDSHVNFMLWLAKQDRQASLYQADRQFLNEMPIHADRRTEANVARPVEPEEASGQRNGGAETK